MGGCFGGSDDNMIFVIIIILILLFCFCGRNDHSC